MTITDIKQKNASIGDHFFDRSTMRFFNSRIGRRVWTLPDGGALFVTSEQFVGSDGKAAPRLYTVRRMEPDGEVNKGARSPSEFQEYRTSAAANSRASALAMTYAKGGDA